MFCEGHFSFGLAFCCEIFCLKLVGELSKSMRRNKQMSKAEMCS